MKELICLIPKSMLPYTFIHIGLATTNSPDMYWKYLMINNDRQQAVQGITVKGFSQELLDKMWVTKDKVTATVAKHFTNHKAILSIEETHKTDKLGRFIFIVYNRDFETAQVFIGNFCTEVFPKIYLTQDEQDKYRVTYLSLPHLVDSPSAGEAVGANGKHLDSILLEAETARGKPFAIGSSTWADRVAPRMIFDQSSECKSTQPRKQSPNRATTHL
jgi:hypothetical protein